MNRRLQIVPRVEPLEERNCPTLLFHATLDSFGNATVVEVPTGTSPNDVRIAFPAPDVVNVSLVDDCFAAVPTVLATTGDLVVPGNFTLTLPNTNNMICYDFNGFTFTGNFTINGGNNSDTLTFIDADGGAIDGNLLLNRVNTVVLLNVATHGNFADYVPRDAGGLNILQMLQSPVDGNATYFGSPISDTVSLVTSNVGGTLTTNLGAGPLNMLTLDAGTTVGGQLIFSGLNGDDAVDLEATTINGSVVLNMGNGNNTLTFSQLAVVHQDLTMIGGSGNDSIDNFLGTLGGNVLLRFGNGANNFYFGDDAPGAGGVVLGSRITYCGGSGFDDVQFRTSAAALGATVNVQLGAGNDSFALRSNAFQRARIDGGPGIDVFALSVVTIDFPLVLLNFP